jgi:hypothetical protein
VHDLHRSRQFNFVVRSLSEDVAWAPNDTCDAKRDVVLVVFVSRLYLLCFGAVRALNTKAGEYCDD